ncbi:MAG: DUF262 domain-containing HNH endonuclease family protein [Flavobacteriaceae bacterium]|nr:DUF262 domain-containing HNH endonuclease family protein [Flavobacteriaceae bacterium]
MDRGRDIDNNRTNILDFIGEEKYIFEIPLFQRDYSWEKGNISRLLQDIKNVIKHKEKKRHHFLGSIVYEKTPGKTNDPDKIYIIDGQQRITTIFLLLFCMKKNQKGEVISDDYFYSKKDENILKIKLKKTDNELLLEIINHKKVRSKTNHLTKCYYYLNKKIEELENNEGECDAINIPTIYDALNKFWIIENPLDAPGDDIHAVFDSINATGKSINLYDKIRNYLHLKQDSGRRSYLFTSKWEPIENRYKIKDAQSKLQTFCEHFIALKINSSFYDCTDNQKKLNDISSFDKFEQFKEWFEEEIKNGKTSEGIFDDFLDNKEDYYDLFIDQEYKVISENKNTATALKKLNAISKLNSHHPFLLGIYNYFKPKETYFEKGKEKDFIELIEIIISYYVRLKLCEKISIGRILPKFYAALCSQINKKTKGTFSDLLKTKIYNASWAKSISNFPKKIPNFPKDTMLKKAFQNVIYREDFFVRYILYYISIKMGDEWEIKNTTLEHIMPESLLDEKYNEVESSSIEEWKKDLKEYLMDLDKDKKVNQKKHSDDIDKDIEVKLKKITEENMYKIGNTTLLSLKKNSKASNKPFAEKKNIYKNSNFKLNTDITEYSKWDPNTIKIRGKKLSEFAINIWKDYPPSNIKEYCLKKIEKEKINVTGSKIKSYSIYDEKYNKEKENKDSIPCKNWTDAYLGIINELHKIKEYQFKINSLEKELWISKKENNLYFKDKSKSINAQKTIKQLCFLCEKLEIGLDNIELELILDEGKNDHLPKTFEQ